MCGPFLSPQAHNPELSSEAVISKGRKCPLAQRNFAPIDFIDKNISYFRSFGHA
jgi:hypothetical protein